MKIYDRKSKYILLERFYFEHYYTIPKFATVLAQNGRCVNFMNVKRKIYSLSLSVTHAVQYCIKYFLSLTM